MPERDRRIEELVDGQNPDLKHLRGAGKGKRGGSKGDVRRGATARGAMEKVGVSGSLRGRRSEEITQSNTSSPRGSEVPLESQRGDGN